MAKSKLINANKKIADNLTNGFQKMSDGVTTGFQKMSDSVVKGYTSIEDAFVDRYLTRDDESIEEAKARLKAEQAEREIQAVSKRQARIEAANERKAEHTAKHNK